ncbi:MAG: D-alanyl-D-alanine carboxypeptidase/D-alanyl-D-alanine-endopeptidase [Pyrinomonadaceae bacterium]
MLKRDHPRNSIVQLVLLICISFAWQIDGQTTRSPVSKPAATPSPTPSAPLPTLADLQEEMRRRLDRPQLQRGHIGIKVVSLSTGSVVFEQNSEKYFMPASNMKNFTVAAALEKLTPDFRFVTTIFASALPDQSGTVNGDLRIFGRGDVSVSKGFADGDPVKAVDLIAERIAGAGIKKITGDIIADDTYFRGGPLPSGWEWDDLQWYYGAEVSALPLNDNAIELSVTPGPVGYICSVRMVPYNPVYRIKNQCMTTAAGSVRTLKIEKLLGQNQLEISGTLPTGNTGFNGQVAVSRPAELFAALLKQRLEEKGIAVTGGYRTMSRMAKTEQMPSVEIAQLESPPLALIAAKTMKPSQNMYTEVLLWTLGENERARLSRTVPPAAAADIEKDSSALGIDAVRGFLAEVGTAPDAVFQYDGSGLSRHNLITPSAVVQLYSYMAKRSKYAQAWRDSLTIGGVDGTLANRFRGSAAEGNIRGKTGTLNQVSALSGYVTTAGGETLIVSFLVNGVAQTRDRTGLIDDLVIALANFKGPIDEPATR